MTRRDKIWLASFKNPDDADAHVKKEAKRLRAFKLTGKWSVGIETDAQGHHVYLYER